MITERRTEGQLSA